MGLDIYFYRVSKKVCDKYNVEISSEPNDIYDAIKNNAKEHFEQTIKLLVPKLYKAHETQSPIEYANAYSAFITSLQDREAHYKMYDFCLKKFGFDADKKHIFDIKTPQEIEKLLNDELSHFYATEDAYFRKVNFIYQYFENKVDECCSVNKYDIEEFLKVCEDVYKHKNYKDYAKEHLPTTNGFFFGSTEYDEWYLQDVKDCIRQMKKLLKTLKDDDFVFIVFSW